MQLNYNLVKQLITRLKNIEIITFNFWKNATKMIVQDRTFFKLLKFLNQKTKENKFQCTLKFKRDFKLPQDKLGQVLIKHIFG